MLELYRLTLSRVLRYRRTTMLITLVMTAVTIWLFMIMPMGLLPSDDIGAISLPQRVPRACHSRR